MAGFNQGEVLDSGRAPSSRQRATGLIVTAVIAGGIALAAIAAGLTWWTSRPPTSDALEITAITVVGPTAVTVVAAPPIGGLATPAGAALPGVTLRVTVGGDPRNPVNVVPSSTDSIAYVEEQPAVTVGPGSFTDMEITVAPVDCSLASEGTDLDEAGYRWRTDSDVTLLASTEGAIVPLSPAARESWEAVLATACEGSGPAPGIAVTAARQGGEPPLETIGLFVDIEATGDRFVVTPLDGPDLRGLGSADRRSGKGIPLLWLLSPRAGSNDEAPVAYAQVYVVRGSTAYPWIVGIPITDDLPEMTPLTGSIR
jgi:hypothetical protein